MDIDVKIRPLSDKAKIVEQIKKEQEEARRKSYALDRKQYELTHELRKCATELAEEIAKEIIDRMPLGCLYALDGEWEAVTRQIKSYAKIRECKLGEGGE